MPSKKYIFIIHSRYFHKYSDGNMFYFILLQNKNYEIINISFKEMFIQRRFLFFNEVLKRKSSKKNVKRS